MTRRKTGLARESAHACIIKVGGACNNRCIFCEPDFDPPVTEEEVYQLVSRSSAPFLIIEGPGEPLLSSPLFRLVHAARRAGAMRIAIFTNGRMLAYPSVARAVGKIRPDVVAVSIHHVRPGEHDSITRAPGSFEQASTGWRNLWRYRAVNEMNIFLRFVPVEENAGTLGAVSKLAREENLDGVIVEEQGGAGVPAERILREMDELKSAGENLFSRDEFEKAFSMAQDSRYSDSGSLPARLHEKERALSLVLRTGCRNACIFCTTRIIQEENATPWPLDHVEFFFDDILKAREKRASLLRIVAIEPIEHPEIAALAGFAKRAGFRKIEAWTSGRALADASLAAQLREAGLTDIDVPLMGSSPPVHDLVTMSEGSFKETVAGIGNAGKARIRCRHHLVVTWQNLDDLGRMAMIGKKLGLGEPASVLIPSPSSEDLSTYEAFMPRLGDVARAIARLPAAPAAMLLEKGLYNNIPPCVIAAACGKQSAMARKRRSAARDSIREGDASEPGAKFKLRKECERKAECRMARLCPGYHDQYERIFGTDEFEPIQST